MPDGTPKIGDRLSPVTKAALLVGLIAALTVGILVAVFINVAAGILVGLLVLVAVSIVAVLALDAEASNDDIAKP
jgi:hypothetical protein